MLLIPGGHCRPQTTGLQGAHQAVQFLMTSSIDKRQTLPAYTTCITNGVQDFLANYPRDCAPAFSSVFNPSNVVSGSSINQEAITAAYRLICQPRCGDPLIAYYNRCKAPRDIIDSFRYECARNSAGRLCYELAGNLVTDLARVSTNCDISTDCTTGCQNALTAFASNSGCCINTLNLTDFNDVHPFTTFDYSVWSGCGVDTPGFCNLETSSLSSAGVSKFVKALFLLTLLVLAMLLL